MEVAEWEGIIFEEVEAGGIMGMLSLDDGSKENLPIIEVTSKKYDEQQFSTYIYIYILRGSFLTRGEERGGRIL